VVSEDLLDTPKRVRRYFAFQRLVSAIVMEEKNWALKRFRTAWIVTND
jgi:hypothetical protein